jgi:arabinofuranosyltransferase
MRLSKTEKIFLLAVLFTTAIILCFGWHLFWFLTDDACIGFRYISNSISGYGYVWNTPPFRPVEGYSNFLWLVLLEWIWRIFGIPPTESSNYLTLVFSFLTLVIGTLMVLGINWNKQNQKYRILFLVLVLAAVLTNRTFLAWTSSGLETAMCVFFITLWVYCCLFTIPLSRVWIFSISACSALIYLTRPDGLLFAVATVIMLVVVFVKEKRYFEIKSLIAAAPFLSIIVHLLWRKSFYGEWLPNTYYAKYTGIWPESGIRYALSFILEYALWFWLALSGFVFISKFPAILRVFNYGHRTKCQVQARFDKSSKYKSYTLIMFITCSTLLVHALYYTLIIGGDHFEYRVYSHLILLIFVSFVWLLNVSNFKTPTSILLLLAFILCSYPIPWTHWYLTHRLETRDETFCLRVPIAEHWPTPFRWYARAFDGLQSWLIEHFVCMRHQEHKICYQWQIARFPPREVGKKLTREGYPVMMVYGAGVPGWVFPEVNIIDYWGLNDYVIARNPCRTDKIRRMAHSREPPDGYIQCFRPNIRLALDKKVLVLQRHTPLTAEDIVECEKNWADRIKGAHHTSNALSAVNSSK